MMARTEPMHPAFRKSCCCFLPILVFTALAACRTHDRVIYSDRPVKNLRVPKPGASSAAEAAAAADAAAAQGSGTGAGTTGGASGTAPHGSVLVPEPAPAPAGALQ